MLEQMIDDWFAECASHYNNFIKALLAGDVKAMNSYMNKVALATSELLERPETEKELRVSPELRQVRLDVVSMDLQKTIYHTEMQKSDTGNLKKRSRYYQAQLDVSLLEPGSVNFNLLNDSCFILIAPFDIFGEGLYRYTFEGTCRECPKLRLEDGATKIFINTKGTNKEGFSQEFLDFMEYITSSTDAVADRTASDKIKLIHENVKKIRASEKMGVKYMQLWEEKALIKEEGRREGISEGRREGKKVGKAETLVKSVEAAMKNFGIDLQRACEGIGTTVEEYHKAKEGIAEHAE